MWLSQYFFQHVITVVSKKNHPTSGSLSSVQFSVISARGAEGHCLHRAMGFHTRVTQMQMASGGSALCLRPLPRYLKRMKLLTKHSVLSLNFLSALGLQCIWKLQLLSSTAVPLVQSPDLQSQYQESGNGNAGKSEWECFTPTSQSLCTAKKQVEQQEIRLRECLMGIMFWK